MKTKVNLRLVTSDENLVTKDEYYLMYEGDEIVEATSSSSDR